MAARVLRLIGAVGAAGRTWELPVGVCGEAAADPMLAAVLVGLGVTSLSMTSRALGRVAAALEAVTEEQCRAAAEAVLEGSDGCGRPCCGGRCPRAREGQRTDRVNDRPAARMHQGAAQACRSTPFVSFTIDTPMRELIAATAMYTPMVHAAWN